MELRINRVRINRARPVLHCYIFSMVSESKFDVTKFYNWQDYFLTAERQLEIPFSAKTFYQDRRSKKTKMTIYLICQFC